VAGVSHIKNPIDLARLGMEKSSHVLMAREGAEVFAVEQGMELVDEKYFFTERRWKQLQKRKVKENQEQSDLHNNISVYAFSLSSVILLFRIVPAPPWIAIAKLCFWVLCFSEQLKTNEKIKMTKIKFDFIVDS